jgi:hypothetical protein
MKEATAIINLTEDSTIQHEHAMKRQQQQQAAVSTPATFLTPADTC